ncbi:MAG: PilZ domain-containing protein [Candidatus Eremiobacteraeota bacterium]|nr:PilZ domain-containing protein [Candidatus Eremiobacteraeota bacterium]
MQEQRKYSRRRCQCRVCYGSYRPGHVGVVTDVSDAGLHLVSDWGPLDRGQPITLAVLEGPRLRPFSARVVWVRQDGGRWEAGLAAEPGSRLGETLLGAGAQRGE